LEESVTLLPANRHGLETDLYELTMAAAYFDNKESFEATFELFVRNYPKNRSYLVAAGLEQAVNYLTQLRFTEAETKFLVQHPNFRNVSDEFFQYLSAFKFTGKLWALPEGTVFFRNEPILRVTAPIIEAQIAETYLLSVINYETLIATKASRIVQSARGKGVVEFGSRRAHGPEAALLAARASYIGGCVGTSNVQAGYLYNIPTYGTMAHSFIMSYDSEEEAFEKFCRVIPEPAFLVDTYDSIEGVKKVIATGKTHSMIRLDSGNRLKLSRDARKMLDQAGFSGTKIFVSGDLNEYILNDLTSKAAPIDFFGVGTELVTSRDDPALPGIYKLVSLTRDGKDVYRVKTSEGKMTLPGPKQIYRKYNVKKQIKEDILALQDERIPGSARPLLLKVLENGSLVKELPSIDEIREFAKQELMTLPPRFLKLTGSEEPPLRLSAKLQGLKKSMWSKAGHR
jgi:nicotinate phosphoribosyltransferase